MEMPFKKCNILLPKKEINYNLWSVIACDQYTSQLDYWDKVKNLVGENPSTLNLILPEVFLEDENVEERIKEINLNMEKYLNENIFEEYNDTMIYLERTDSTGKVREGLIGKIDLEAYDYNIGSNSLVRATEKTVIERIPPRKKVRQNALLELPHIMILIDDEKKNIIESLKNKVSSEDLVYDFDLMLDAGHIKGYKLGSDTIDEITTGLLSLGELSYFNNKYNVNETNPLLFAMGDGNHSLATAKACWEDIKKELTEEERENHPARYALVELVNIHSDALDFEPIHRVIFKTNASKLIESLKSYYITNEEGKGQELIYITKEGEKKLYIENPRSNLTVGSLQIFLDEYLKENEGKIDYIHGDEITRQMGSKEGNISFLLPKMEKSDLFRSVILDGALPRKTFSMGHSDDKRFYLESRKIK